MADDRTRLADMYELYRAGEITYQEYEDEAQAVWIRQEMEAKAKRRAQRREQIRRWFARRRLLR